LHAGRLRSNFFIALSCFALTLACSDFANSQTIRTQAEAREVAARFAPIFYQGIGDDPRADLMTNFDFDGDWRGDNNWAHLGDEKYPLKAYVYYAVSETPTHLFIHYAVFHPRDYKGGAASSGILGQIINEGLKRGAKFDPRAADVAFSHENDLEGCLVVVRKGGNPADDRLAFIETVAHNRFLMYDAAARAGNAAFRSDGQHPLLYIEPKGHGIQAYNQADADKPHNLLRYSYRNLAEAPAPNAESASYDLLPIETSIYAHARKGINETFGARANYGQIKFSVTSASGGTLSRTVRIGVLGSAFLGRVGKANMARPPWAWFDQAEREAPAGAWFFDPAATIKRHFNLGNEFSVAYTWQPFLGVGVKK
jgi:hypothetical protein